MVLEGGLNTLLAITAIMMIAIAFPAVFFFDKKPRRRAAC